MQKLQVKRQETHGNYNAACPLPAGDSLEVEPKAELQTAWRSGSGSSGVNDRGDPSEAGIYRGDISAGISRNRPQTA
jgi:hypothetical protein